MPNLSSTTPSPASGSLVSMKKKPSITSSPSSPIIPHHKPTSSLFKPHMKTTRVRSIAAAARGSTLLLPLDTSADLLTLSPLSLPWASLLCTNPAYPSIDVTDDQILIGRKPPCQLIVNHQAISGIHCRVYRKGGEGGESGGMKKVEEGKKEDEEEEEEEEEKVNPDAVIDDKNKRRSHIKVSEMINFLHSDQTPEEVVWKGTKTSTMTQQRDQTRPTEIWLEDLSTNGTFLGEDGSATKIGNGNKVAVTHGSTFTLLVPTSSCHERISYSLRVNGVSPVGDSVDDAPTDTVTIVFTDIESSTNLWEASPQGMQTALEEHDRVLRTLLARFRGYEVKTEGDAFMVAFHSVLDAVKWCLAVQEALLRMKWDDSLLTLPSARKEYVDSHGNRTLEGSDAQLVFNGLRVRMGLNVGQPSCRRNPTTKRMDYYGKMVNLAARVSDAGYGGQIVCTEEVCQIVQQEVQREKERAEQEWVEEREEEGEDDQDIDDEEKESTDSLHPIQPHHRLDSLTPPHSIHSTLNDDVPTSLRPISPRRLPMSPDRFTRIQSHLNKKPSTLDHTLDHLTDLHSVTFLDCGSALLKGIGGGTRIYQVSSMSLVGRRWEPKLRAKGMKVEGGEGTVVGEGAPVAPPCAPLTLTLYNKHSIPVQIRRNILRRRKEKKEEDGGATGSGTAGEGSPARGGMKGDAVRKLNRGSVRFAGTSIDRTVEEGLEGIKDQIKEKQKIVMQEEGVKVEEQKEQADESDTLELDKEQVPIVREVSAPETVPAPRPVVAPRLSGSSALAAAILQNRAALMAEAKPAASSGAKEGPVASSIVASAQIQISAPAPSTTSSSSTSQSPALSAAAKPFTPSPSSLNPIAVHHPNLSQSASSPSSPTPSSHSKANPSQPPPIRPTSTTPRHRHHRSISTSRPSKPNSRHTNRSRDADHLAQLYSAAFDAEAQHHKATRNGHNKPRTQPRHYSTLKPTTSHAPPGHDALYAQQAQIRAQVIAQQQAVWMAAYQQQQQQQAMHAQWVYIQQQQQMGGHGVEGGGQLFFPPAQTPSFGLSPAVSSAVPYSYSFPAGSQWSNWQ